MSSISKTEITRALAEVVREMLIEGEEVHISGLGTFRLHHQISKIDEQPDGVIVMKPPKDVIAFSADM